MKLIAIPFLFFLCSRLLSGLSLEVFSQKADCDDEDVLKAVDAALKMYNKGNHTANLFVLYRIDNVTKTDELNPIYSFKFLIKEGDCPVQSGKTWKDCGYKQSADAATGECTAMVEKLGKKNFEVITQSCEITPVEGPPLIAHHGCPGCQYPVSTEDSNVKYVLKHAVSHFNNRSTHSHLFDLRKVKRAYKQVVAGLNIDITYSITQTNCSKMNFPLLTPDCQALSNGDNAECTDSASIDLSQRIIFFSQQCNLFPARGFVPLLCVGCAKDLPVNSPELDEVLNHTFTKLNADRDGTFYFKIDNVKKATVQVVSGLKYNIEFLAKETTCSKESNTGFTKSCETKEAGQVLTCDADVIMVPWMNKTTTTVNCDSQMRLLKTCEYQVPLEARTRPAPGSAVESPQQAQ